MGMSQILTICVLLETWVVSNFLATMSYAAVNIGVQALLLLKCLDNAPVSTF